MPPTDTSSSRSGAPEPTARYSVLAEVGGVYAAVTLVVGVLAQIRSPPWLEDLALLGIAVVFVGVPLHRARRESRGPERFGIDLSGVLDPGESRPTEDDDHPKDTEWIATLRVAIPDALREIGFALAVCVVVFPPFVVAFAWWNHPVRGFGFVPDTEFISYALGQFVLIALPEEVFFRGYIQTRLHDRFPPRGSVLGAPLDWRVWIGQAALFALIHLVSEFSFARLAVFFPGLVFGWMRARRGGVGAALVFHALCNILATALARGWL